MSRIGMVVFMLLSGLAAVDGVWGGHVGRGFFWLLTGGAFAALDWAELHSRAGGTRTG